MEYDLQNREIDKLYRLLIAPVTFLILLQFSLWTYAIPILLAHPELVIGSITVTNKDLFLGAAIAINGGGLLSLSILSYIFGFFKSSVWGYRLRMIAIFLMISALVYSSLQTMYGLVTSLDLTLTSIALFGIAALITIVLARQVKRKISG